MEISHDFMTIKELAIIQNEIHLNPAWQRGPVWSNQKKALLIDSILRGYDVPMIYLRECPPHAQFKYEVVDGQQRLLSIWGFINGTYSLTKDLENIGKFELFNKKYSELSKNLQTSLNKFKIAIAVVKNAREPEISRLFSRMQMGVRLNPAELRNAVQSGLRHAIDATARLHPFFQNSRIPSARFKHQDYLAHSICFCIHGTKRDLKATQLMEDYSKPIDDQTYVPIIDTANEILDFMYDVNKLTSKRIKQKWIFVDLFYLIYHANKKVKKIKLEKFVSTYLKFDQERLKYNSEPKRLLSDNTSPENQELYNYIMAFNISGGERKNLEVRNNMLKRRFYKVIGV